MTLKFKRRELLLALGTAIWVSACQSKPRSNQEQSSPSRRIVALEWGFVESLLTLGIQPVGVADIKGYREYVNIPPKLAESAQEVGTRQEPNLEAIAQLKPDLILGVNFRHQPIISALESIAPTRLFNAYAPNVNRLTQFEERFLEIAKLTNHQEKGEAKLQQLETTIADVKQELTEQGVTKHPIVLAAFVPPPSPLRVFTNDSFPIQLLNAIGLKNAWDRKFSQFGFNRVGLESLTKLEDINFIYVPLDENPQVEKQITNKPLWKKLPFVQNDQIYRLDGDTWLYGGVLSAEILVQQVRNHLSS
ncbi:MAG: ABC transporter substrate-binding protein [Cyanobacteria bacterium]|jgi:iron complex transport system substrate-binding protein|nr:ABC transporter substrate-binding protein [Cyanobacteria bacterium GSL.Bin21]